MLPSPTLSHAAMVAHSEDPNALTAIGWRGDPPPADLPPGWRVVRVIAQHRAGYGLHDGREALNGQPAARYLRRDLDPSARPAVGDFVLLAPGNPPHIEAILPRRTELRRAEAGETLRRQVIASNIDHVLVLTGLDGDFNPARIERYLLLVQASGAEPVLVLTKADQGDAAAALAGLRERLPDVPMLAVDARSPQSVAPLRQWLQPGHTVVLVGSSGAGKSTLTNTLLGDRRQATGAVRGRDSRGRHTTTHRALIQLPGGACLIDTPGMRELRLTGDEDLDEGQFADIEELAAQCRFGDCAHGSEPGCAVQAALEEGRLAPERWRNYEKLRDELAATADALEARMWRRGEGRHPGRGARDDSEGWD